MTDFTSIWKAQLNERKHLDGVIAEFGCFDGSSTKALAALGRPVFAFDTFCGMPSEGFDVTLDKENPPGKFNTGKTVQQLFTGYSNIIPVIGPYQETAWKFSLDTKVVLAYLDCDWYSSFNNALIWLILRKHLHPQGIITFHDYSQCAGVRKAVDEWVAKYNLKLTVGECSIIDPAGSLYA